MSDLIYFERVEAYAEGQMKAEDAAQFEKELQENNALKQEYEAYLASQKAMEGLAYDLLRAKMAKLEKKKEAKRFFIGRRMLSIAAGFLLLIAATSGLLYSNLSYSNQSLYADHFEFPNVSLIRGESDAESAYDNAVQAYQNKDFDTAVNELNAISAEESIYNSAQYFLGAVYLESKRPEQAASVFQNLLQKNDKRYDKNVEWNLVLTYLQSGNTQEVNNRIDAILAEPNHPFANQARQLKKNMNSFWRKMLVR